MKKRIQGAAFVLALMLMALSANQARATVVDDRINERLGDYITNPPTLNNDVKANYALAVLKLWTGRSAQEHTNAQTYINDLCNLQNPLPSTGASYDVVSVFFEIPLLLRMYLDTTLSANLTQTNKDNIERVLWEYVNAYSKVADAGGTVWNEYGSENKNSIHKTSCLLACQALIPHGAPYNVNLRDGQSLTAHMTAWKKHLFEHFRQRAREGLTEETNSMVYAGNTLGPWYNIADLCSDGNLKALAKQAIDLFWADYANEITPDTGVRVVAGCRIGRHVLDDTNYPLYDMAYCYNWHENANPFMSTDALLAVSPYRMPDTVWAIGTDDTKTAYTYASRRFGRGTGAGSVTFGANHASDIRREIYWTPDYILGGQTFKTDGTAYDNCSQIERTVGVVFSNEADEGERIAFYGSPYSTGDDHWRLGDMYSYEVTSVVGKNCMVAVRDKNAESTNTRIFLSDGNLWNNRVPSDGTLDNGWLFTQTNDLATSVYVGIRFCNGTYTASYPADGGARLTLSDKAAPVIIEVGTSRGGPPYNTFAFFQAVCKAMSFSYDTGTKKLTYTSTDSDTYEVWGNSATLPKKNGVTVDLNPAKTYDSPYVSMGHGQDLATINYTGYTSVTLDFNYYKAPMWDDYQTTALWHMDTIVSGKVADDDLEASTRNHDLTITGATCVTDTGTDNGYNALMGNCLSFTGATQYGSSTTAWPGDDNVTVDFWFKPGRVTGNQTLITASGRWGVRLEGTALRFYITDSAGSTWSLYHTTAVTNGAWHHVTAAASHGPYNIWGLTLDGATVWGGGHLMKNPASTVYVGGDAVAGYYFQGKIDDVKIRRCDDQ